MTKQDYNLSMYKVGQSLAFTVTTNWMSRYYFLLLFIIVCMLNPTVTKGQQVTTDTTEERMDEASFKTLKEGYNYVIRAEEDEISMFKVDLLSSFLYILNDDWSDSIPVSFLRLRFERKWKPNLSWQVGTDWQGIGNGIEEIHLLGGIRYYYNMNKRILKGKSANNFSADYFGVSLLNKYEPPKGNYGLSLNLTYGLQRRLGKYGYLDFDIGFENTFKATSSSSTGIQLISTIQLGFAF